MGRKEKKLLFILKQENGEKIIFPECSDEDLEYKTGDFIVELHQIENPNFKRNKEKLLLTKKINLCNALLPKDFSIVFLDGRKIIVSQDPKKIITPNSITSPLFFLKTCKEFHIHSKRRKS